MCKSAIVAHLVNGSLLFLFSSRLNVSRVIRISPSTAVARSSLSVSNWILTIPLFLFVDNLEYTKVFMLQEGVISQKLKVFVNSSRVRACDVYDRIFDL